MNLNNPKPGQTIQEAAVEFLQFRSYQPFRFSGRHFVGVDDNGQAWVYRTKKAAENRAAKTTSRAYAAVG